MPSCTFRSSRPAGGRGMRVLLLAFGRNGPLGALLEPLGIVFAFRWTGPPSPPP